MTEIADANQEYEAEQHHQRADAKAGSDQHQTLRRAGGHGWFVEIWVGHDGLLKWHAPPADNAGAGPMFLRQPVAACYQIGCKFKPEPKNMPRDVHLVGSVPLASAREVFETVGAALGRRLRRIPDGETAERADWITWLEPVFAGNTALEKSDEVFRLHATATPRIRYRLKPGRSAQDVRFDNLFYADIAQRSFEDFARAKRDGKIPVACRFQIDLVPAHSVIWLYLQDDLHAPLDPVYNAALKLEIEKISARLPHDQIAIQFDVASAVFARLERNDVSSYGKGKAETHATFARILADLADHVPGGIELLFHFCYGDSNHRHVVEPTDMADMVEMANRLTDGIRRPIQLIHMPVPRDRSDDAYFAPLRNLRLKPHTQLCLGLVHLTDGVAGSRRRLAAAEKVVTDFSIGTECGFGRRKPETIPELLRIHAEVAR